MAVSSKSLAEPMRALTRSWLQAGRDGRIKDNCAHPEAPVCGFPSASGALHHSDPNTNHPRNIKRHIDHQQGFTLLEVMVALTITGLALGGLFGVIGGSKRLAWRSEKVLVHSAQVRSLINYTQLNDERGEAIVDFSNPELRLFDSELLEVPERQTQGSIHQLRGYYIVDENDQVVVNGSYWVELDLPE